MTMMSRTLAAVLLIVAACSGPSTTSTTVVRQTTPQPTRIVTTTTPTQEVQIQSCASPPVTFSSLCEIYALLETWYVDAPIDAELLAEVATRGLGDYVTAETEVPPRTLFCAIPDDAFTEFCEEMARRVAESQLPVGPAVEAVLAHMIDVGLDPFTYYLPPDQTGALRLNGIVGGIGLLLDARDAMGSKCTQITSICRLEVVVALEDNPGFEAGLTEGDVILTVDGEPVEGKGFTAVVALIAGDETGTVTMTVDRGGDALELSIERAELVVPTVEIGLPLGDVAYIRIPDFETDIPELVTEGLRDLAAESPDTFVIDLRDNPGGYIDAFLEVADQFVDGGVVMISDAPDEHLEYEATAGGLTTDPDLVVLVNQGTASAAEILAGALRDRRGAVVVGTNTFGKDAVQIPFTLRNGGEFYVAVARWSTPNGDTAGDGGLSPDRSVTWPVGASVEEIVELALEAAS